MTPRERILTTLQGGIPDRVGTWEHFWGDTVQRWRREGHLGGEEDPYRHFGLDFGPLGGPDLSLRFPQEVVEETPDYRIVRDNYGVLRKELRGTDGHTPGWLEHTLVDRAAFVRHRERLEWCDERLDLPGLRKAYEELRARGLFIHLDLGDGNSFATHAMGQVAYFTQMLDDPELIREVFAACTDLILQGAERMLEAGLDFDGCWISSDLGYRNGLLFSPTLYERLLFPEHQRLCRFFRERGKPVVLHSCGRIQELIPRFIEAGFAAIQPLEAKAGQDVRELKRVYGKQIVLFGNMDVRRLSGTLDEARDEVISKLTVAMEGGGYIFHSDHSVPPTVPYENYRLAVELVRERGRY